MSNTDRNDRAVVGDNQAPAYAQRVTEQMARDYEALSQNVEALLDRAREQPKEVTSDEEATAMGLVVKEIREADKRAEAYRTAEKEPHRLSAEAVDAFFFALREKLARRNPRDRTQKPGAADVLQGRIDRYLEQKRVEEENRRREEAARLRREAEEAERKRLEAARLQQEAEEAARRARKPENVEARKQEVAQAAQATSEAAVEAEVAKSAAVDAHLSTLAKPAELSRTRGSGVLLTEARQPYAEVVDRTKLDKEKLWVFFTDAEIEKALRGWARTTGHNQQMDGAEIGHRAKGVTR